jgi:uncharacterized protein YeaO (DUF488 family)
MVGSVTDTYAAAVSNDLTDVGSGTLVGVVRRPPRWFHGVVSENHRELGPPAALLDAVQERRERLKTGGMCDEGAHNAAWDEVEFERRYAEYLDSDGDARAAIESLADRVARGESLALVCFEGPNKACHRRLLADRLRGRVERAVENSSDRESQAVGDSTNTQ